MLNFQDLPDELVLKVLRYSETRDLISCGRVSRRIRRISYDSTLWVSANLEKKIVKTELLEVILKKGCRILNLRHSTILGTLSSNIESQLRVLNLSQLAWTDENTAALEELLFSCCSLQELVMEEVDLTMKMVVSICVNGKTLETLNLHSADSDILIDKSSFPFTYYSPMKEIIQCCQELKEVDLAYVNYSNGLSDDDLDFLLKNIPPNVEKLNLINTFVMDRDVKTLLSRCTKIKALGLEARCITDNSIKNIKKHLNLTLEELSLGRTVVRNPLNIEISFNGFLELKSMQRLKFLNIYYRNDDDEEIQNLRQHLPHLIVKCVLNFSPIDKIFI